MKTLAESEKELLDDVIFLKKLHSETQRKVSNLRKQFRHKMKGVKNKEAHLVNIVMDMTSKEQLDFLDLEPLVKKLINDESLDIPKIRHVRDTFLKLIINLDKVTIDFLNNPALTISKQMTLYLNIFEGIDGVDEQKNTISELKRLMDKRNEPARPLSSVDGLAKARILLSFYAKWLTRAENEFTDRKLEDAVQKQKEFISTLKRILNSLSNAKSQAENESKYETRIELLQTLVETFKNKESKFQEFFENNPDFLNRQVSGILSKKSFGGEQFPDLILKLSNGNYIIVELEKPTFKLFTNSGDPSKELSHAEQQVRGYLAWANEDKEFLRKRGLENLSAENTTGLVIIGDNMSVTEKKKLESLNDTIRGAFVVKTFNDVLEENMACLQNLRKYPLKLVD